MPTRNNRTITSSPSQPKFDWGGYHLTSGDISRLLNVDLKTVHNWVDRGQVRGRRTEGRHLRFARPEVVRFLRQKGHPVPRFLGTAPPRAIVDAQGARATPLVRALGKTCEVSRCAGLFACSLTIAAGHHEIAIVDLDAHGSPLVSEFVAAIRSWDSAEQLCLIGVSSKPALVREFLRAGGNAVVDGAHLKDVAGFVRWLVGAEKICPTSVRFSNG